MVAVLSGHI